MNKSDQEPDEHNVGVDISAFIVALKEIANTDIAPEAIKMLLASIYIKPQSPESKEDISASVKGADDSQRNVDMLRMLSESARSQQEFTVFKFLLAKYETQHPAKGLKQKSKGHFDETVQEDRSKKRRTRNGSNEMKAGRSGDVPEVKPSTSQPNGLSKYKCFFCDSTLSGLAGIKGHYERKHEIINPTEILFYDGEPLFTLPSSNINTQGGKASWFVKEKINALEKYRAGTCRLCEKELEDPEILSKHYEINHKVADLRKVEHLFKFRTGAHLDGLPTSNPRKQRQPRQRCQRRKFKKKGFGSKRSTSARSTGTIILISSSDGESDNDSNVDRDDSNYIGDTIEHDANEDATVAIERLLHCAANLSTILSASRKVENEENLLDETNASIQNNNHVNTGKDLEKAIPTITSVKTERVVDSEETSVQDTEMADRNSRDDDSAQQ